MQTREAKLANRIGNELDTLDFNALFFAFAFERQGSGVQFNMWEIILAMLNRWAGMFKDSEVEPGDKMYNVCELSYRMLAAISTPETTGRHAKDD